MLFDRLTGIFGASGVEPAMDAKKGRKHQLIPADQAKEQGLHQTSIAPGFVRAPPFDLQFHARGSERRSAPVRAEGFRDAHAILRGCLGWSATGRSSQQDTEVPDRILELVRHSRSPALLLACLVASAALHAVVILALPDAPSQPVPLRWTVLEVVLVQTTPSAPPPVPDSAAGRDPRRSTVFAERVPGARPAARPRTTARPPLPTILTLPDIPSPDSIAVPLETEPTAPVEPPEPAPRVAKLEPRTLPSFSAAYLRNPAPRYPLAARRAGEQGTVTLKVLVGMDGMPQRVEVEKTSGSPRLDSAALDAVRRWRFAPARRGSTPIESWVLVPVVFRLENPS